MIVSSRYKRSFTIPSNVNHDMIDDASYVYGVLSIIHDQSEKVDGMLMTIKNTPKN